VAPYDEAQVRTVAAQQTQTMTELTVQRARIHSELIQLLTPDQKTKLTQLMAEREQKFKSHPQAAAQQQ
jgi:Spy/CpxP family protein refolding chaperone